MKNKLNALDTFNDVSKHYNMDYRAWSDKWKKMIYSDDEEYTIDILGRTAWKGSADDESIQIMPAVMNICLPDCKLYVGDLVMAKTRGNKDLYVTVIIMTECGLITLFQNQTDYDNESCLIAIFEKLGNVYENPEWLLDNL